MCGILGFIGKSVNPKASFELANALLVKTEVRGEHATGFYACEAGGEGDIFFDKEPVKSSFYVNRDIWSKGLGECDFDLLVAHCRYSSTGVGTEKFNKNNHPHISSDKRTALIHNGRVPEYQVLKTRYDMSSDCDSELLLRILESIDEKTSLSTEGIIQKDPSSQLELPLACRLHGLKEVFARINYGAMAVAVADRADDGGRYLWLFRDDSDRPIHVIDLRKTLGQVVFCSTTDIWKSALDICPQINSYINPDQCIIEFPSYQAWLIGFDAKGKWILRKYRINKTKMYESKQGESDDIKFTRKKGVAAPAKVISRLAENEELITFSSASQVSKKNSPVISTVITSPENSSAEITETTNNPENTADHSEYKSGLLPGQTSILSCPDADLDDVVLEVDMENFDKFIKEIKSKVEQIEVRYENITKEKSLKKEDAFVVIESLKSVLNELNTTLVFLG